MSQEQELGSRGLCRLHERLHAERIPHNCVAYNRAVARESAREVVRGDVDWPVLLLLTCYRNVN